MSDLASHLVSLWCLFGVCLVFVWLRYICVTDMGVGLRPFVVRSSFLISDPSTYLLLNHSVTYALTYHSVSYTLTVHCYTFACQAWGNVYCQRVGCIRHSSGIRLGFLWCSLRASRGTIALLRPGIQDPDSGSRNPPVHSRWKSRFEKRKICFVSGLSLDQTV